MFRKFIITMAIALLANPVFSQASPTRKITYFSSRMDKPITVDVQTNASGATVIVQNQSYFKYLVLVQFTSVINLKYRPMQTAFKTPHGSIRGQTIPPLNKNMFVHVSYKFSFNILPSDSEKVDFTYLYPVGNQRNMKDYLYKENEIIYRDMYTMKKGDTVFCMRKGIITNLISNEGMADRIGPEGSVEILHDDGTVMVYTGISRNPENMKRGKVMFPGQSIGIMDNEQNVLTTFLCYIKPDNRIEQMNIKFPEDCFASFAKSENADCVVTYPSELIQTEMSKPEKKKYLAGKLY